MGTASGTTAVVYGLWLDLCIYAFSRRNAHLRYHQTQNRVVCYDQTPVTVSVLLAAFFGWVNLGATQSPDPKIRIRIGS